MEILTAQAQEKGAAYRIAYNGRVLGDDKGFSSLEACEAEMSRRVAKDHADAIKYDRQIMLRKGGI